MKKRLHDKHAGISILVALIAVSLAEVIFRAVVLSEMIFTTPNFGQPFATMILAAIILIMTLLGKDRVCFICYGVLVSCFALNQFYGLPSVLADIVVLISKADWSIALSPIFHMIGMICIIIIGVLVVEYLDDGTIYNGAFNIVCGLAVLSIWGAVVVNLYNIFNGVSNEVFLAIFNNLYSLIMVFLLAFFAYDSAKLQLKKTKLS